MRRVVRALVALAFMPFSTLNAATPQPAACPAPAASELSALIEARSGLKARPGDWSVTQLQDILALRSKYGPMPPIGVMPTSWQPCGSSDSAACTDNTSIKIVRVDKLEWVLSHELGHNVESKIGNEEYDELHARKQCHGDSNYSAEANTRPVVGPGESFAENFRQFLTDPVALELACPEHYEFFRTKVLPKVGGSDYRLYWDLPSIKDAGHDAVYESVRACLTDLEWARGDQMSIRARPGRELIRGYMAHGHFMTWCHGANNTPPAKRLLEAARRDPKFCLFGEQRFREQYDRNVYNLIELAVRIAGTEAELAKGPELFECMNGKTSEVCTRLRKQLP